MQQEVIEPHVEPASVRAAAPRRVSLRAIVGSAAGGAVVTMRTRASDAEALRFLRNDGRLFEADDNLWRVRTREGERGPFLSRRSAAIELCEYIATMEFVEEYPERVPGYVDRADVTIVHCGLPSLF